MKQTPFFNRTKIVATIGPATCSIENLSAIIDEGVDVCRLNFSHGSYEDHKQVIDNINAVNKSKGTFVAKLLDLQGPKLRVGEMKDGKITLKTDSIITVTTKPEIGTAERISVKFNTLPADVKPGELILLDDGKLQLEVLSSNGVDEIKCKVTFGGALSSKKGFNLPHTNFAIPKLMKNLKS